MEQEPAEVTWLRALWTDIKGNVKYGLLVLLLSAAWTGLLALTKGLKLWQQLGLTVIFVAPLVWAILATVQRSRGRTSELQPKGESLRQRLFALSRQIKDYVKSYGDEPQDIWRSNMSQTEFVWENKPKYDRLGKMSHGFYLHFYNKVLMIYHECGEHGSTEDELWKLLGKQEYEGDQDFFRIAELLARLAAKVEE
ncbi:MAG TPA: hypothetical protein VF532_16230 [Candidatus Angelobacter sp.]